MTLPNNDSIRTPITFDGEITRSVPGLAPTRVTRISTIFDRQIQSGLHPGAQLVVILNGQIVLDRWGGYTDSSKKHRVSPGTRFLAFSIAKPFTSMCIFKLIEQNKIDLTTPVAEYWPEFGTQGKEKITIKQVLLHQAGIPRRGMLNQITHISDWERISENLASQRLEYLPGRKTAYHTLNFGFILGEVIRRVSGMDVDEYLHKEFLGELGLVETRMKGVDRGHNSYAQLTSGTLDHRFIAWMFNLSSYRKALSPASSLQTTARELAVFFQMLLNEGLYAGVNFLQPESVRLATSLGFEGFDQSLRRTTRWGYGFYLGGDHELNPHLPDGMGKGSSSDTFGHYGQRTSMALADKKTGLVVVFLCNRFLSFFDYKNRLREITDAVWDALE
jgi:CubicO group peptidase (beta-lactamase class C family)